MLHALSAERLQFKFSSDGDEADDAHGSDCEFPSSECKDCVAEDDGSERYDRESAIKLLTALVVSGDLNAHANTTKTLYDMMPDAGAPETWAELDRFNVLEQKRINIDRTSEGYMRIECSYDTSFILFRGKFVEIRAGTSLECYNSRFVNLCAFQARLATVELDNSVHFMIPSMRTVLEHDTERCSVTYRSIFVMLAAVWILHGRQLFFHHIVVHPPPTTTGNWRTCRPGDL
ncbi:hypothetical protein ASPVEDRAFT_155905 [Aspergillus versicolor CBS 583.65]|uniref:Uncharacterized protein n=1 Tax=Aspergillus versicolor CBS 583.65 TaxID=1036611 RepID=A0A1L9Q378_ASPVE|nr:uncharacterized protein ASPVEDRAFT_155905 [Aspergillus versicolor CBS 583.65]OJJ08200.1 hypothetical protein ASPVEDRAFT_155905 [Aspergillus versicolor CBS 583.65]